MLYKSASNRRQVSLFWDLEIMLLPKHPLLIFANMVDWTGFEKAFVLLFCADNGRPPKPIRLMTGLLMLKHLRNVSDEQVNYLYSSEPLDTQTLHSQAIVDTYYKHNNNTKAMP